MLGSSDPKPVMLPPGRARLCTKPWATGNEHDGDGAGRPSRGDQRRRRIGHEDVGSPVDQLLGERLRSHLRRANDIRFRRRDRVTISSPRRSAAMPQPAFALLDHWRLGPSAHRSAASADERPSHRRAAERGYHSEPTPPATVSSARFKLRARSTQDSNRLLMNAFQAPVCEPWGTCQERLTVSAAILSQAM